MPNPLITLTTDFGLSDHFVGVMKGVIAGIAPRARVVDITHEVGAFEITEGAFTIQEAYRYFPKGTIHVVVIDPGVGSARRPILAEMGGQYFIAPDNGVLSMVYEREKPEVRHITADRFFLKPVSRTFHGRDIFSSVAAHLACGLKPAKFGKRIEDYIRFSFHAPEQQGGRWKGLVLKVDRFGNLITNFHIDRFGAIRKQPFEITIGSRTLNRLALTFSDIEPGQLAVLAGSSGYLEITANRASAAQILGCGAGSPVELAFH